MPAVIKDLILHVVKMFASYGSGEIMPAVIKDLILHVVKMFASYGSDVKLLALSSSSFLINWKGT